MARDATGWVRGSHTRPSGTPLVVVAARPHLSPMPASPRARLALALLATLAVVGCDSKPAPNALPEADDRLARAYIHALHDSGVVAVLGRTKRETAGVPAFAFGVEAMRGLLPRGPLDTVQLERFQAVPQDSTRTAPATRLTYGVRGGDRAAQVDVWVERENGRPVVEDIQVARRRN
jgi:hypothetical protein